MGLLTDPGAGRGKLTQVLVCHHSKLCALSYIGGVIWFTLLARDAFNAGTYFSENALLPGLVKEEFDESAIAKTYLSEINDEADRYPDEVPYPWLIAKLKQLNLDTYTHNFTLHYPLGPGRKFTGKNVYGILRAPRGASTEALVLTIPYRPPNSIHPTTAPSLALALSLAKFFRKQKYWAKDIIFLVTEHEQLGVQAWLEAYHGVSCGRDGVLDAGSLSGRGGSIQAAINLEIHSDQVASIDVKIEGLNGQLPNLDLVNLVHRMCLKEGIRHTFKDRDDPRDSETYEGWMHAFHTLMLMVFTQASGVPNGNHGLFHRFGIEAVTIEGFAPKVKSKTSPAGFYQLGKVVERVFRSLNNLLERFHQSFFFYLLPATDRYISIGMYMPPLGMIGGGLLIKAFVLWLKMQEDKESSPYSEKSRREEREIEEREDSLDHDKETKIAEEKESNKEKEDVNDDDELMHEESSKLHNPANFKEQGVQSIRNGLAWACAVFLCAHVIGLALLSSTKAITTIGYQYLGLPTEASLFTGFVIASILLIIIFPAVCSSASEKPSRSQSNGSEWAPFLNIAALLELATVLLAISMHNFSLGLVYAVVFTPSALWIAPTKSRLRKGIQRILWLPLQPIILLVIVSLVYTAVMFPEEFVNFDQSFLTRAFSAASNALTFSVVDSYAYGSWVFPVGCSLLLPNWLLFWAVVNA